VDAFNLVADWLLVKPSGVATATGSAASAISLTDMTPTTTVGGTLSFSVAVSSATAGVGSVPTGSVQFLVDNAAAGSGVALVNGTAAYSLVTTGLAAGVHVVSAVYSGDSVYTGSKSSVQIDLLSATAPDFALTPSVATVTTKSGTSAPGVTFSVASLNGFAGLVTFTASTTSATLSTTSNPTFNPAQVTLTSGGTGSTVLTLSAFLPYGKTGIGMAKPAASAGLATAGLAAAVLAGLLCLCVPRRRKRWAGLVMAVLAVGALGVSGCASGTAIPTSAAPINTPAGTYTVLVTATGTTSAGAVTSHNATITFVVQ
jgi:hypothetical protein